MILPSIVITVFGYVMANGLLFGLFFLAVRGTRAGIFGGLAVSAFALTGLIGRAAWQLQGEAEDRRNLARRGQTISEFYIEGKRILMYRPSQTAYLAHPETIPYLMDFVNAEFDRWHRGLYQHLQEDWGPMQAQVYVGQGWPRQGNEDLFDTIVARLVYLERLGLPDSIVKS